MLDSETAESASWLLEGENTGQRSGRMAVDCGHPGWQSDFIGCMHSLKNVLSICHRLDFLQGNFHAKHLKFFLMCNKDVFIAILYF